LSIVPELQLLTTCDEKLHISIENCRQMQLMVPQFQYCRSQKP